jgi:hypothetical protein
LASGVVADARKSPLDFLVDNKNGVCYDVIIRAFEFMTLNIPTIWEWLETAVPKPYED